MMKLIKNGDMHDIESLPVQNPIAIEVMLSTDGVKWTNPVGLLLDSGNTGTTPLYLGQDMLRQLGLNPEIIGNAEAELADGSKTESRMVHLHVQFRSVPSGQVITILNVPAAISDTATEGLFGLGLLALCNCVLRRGEIALLELA